MSIIDRLMTWSPSEQELQQLAERLRRIKYTAETVLILAVLAAVVYFFAEAVAAFLPGGPVDRIREAIQ